MKRLWLVAFLCSVAGAQSPIDKLTPAALAHGKQLYENQCSVCHGMTGTGGKGARLAVPKLRHAPDFESLVGVIVNGIPGTEMPANWQINPTEVVQVAGYVRTLGQIAVVNLPGNAGRGKTIYESKGGCASCHIVRGVGTALGPELTEIGASRSADYLREAVVKPGATVPEPFRVVSATTRDGKTIRGERITEDSFTIQLRDAAGRMHSLRKSELTKFDKLPHESLMPSYESRLSAAELDDLIAYLASLRGEQ